MTGKDNSEKALSFEQALARLETIVERLETGEADLEESIRIYEEGMKLKARCEKKLEQARLRVEKIVAAPGGGVTTEAAPDLASGGSK